MAKHTSILPKDVTLTGFLADKLPKISLCVGIAFLAASVGLYFKDPHHFMYSYLTSFMFYLACALGALFFVLIQHLSRAGWSVLVRRVSEVVMNSFWVLAILFIPILLNLETLYHWLAPEMVNDHIIQGKVGYLNVGFFIARAVLFFGVWIFISRKFMTGSVRQDESGDSQITLQLQKASTWGVALFALTLTFSSIDWVMSLTPHWYSTMFGVYYFATCMVAGLSLISLLFMILRRAGFLRELVTVEHFHDFAKFIYGFNIFWSYIAFSQYFLIWYANIPEETAFFHTHFNGSWSTVAVVLLLGHFVIPFLAFMSRQSRRNLPFHCGMILWLLAMSFLDLYWIIMPTVSPDGVHFGISDVVPFIGIGGLFFADLFRRLKSVNLVPIKDPRLHESVNFHNV